jgi:hypothetical protein
MPTLPLRTELNVQTKLVDCVNDELDGHAFKASNRFKLGILDLSVQLPGYAHCFIEVKYMRDGFIRRVEAPLHLTPHQARFIVDHVDAGGCAGWLMVVALGNDAYALDSSMRVPSSGVLLFDKSHWLIKKRGESWPMEQVVKSLQR